MIEFIFLSHFLSVAIALAAYLYITKEHKP
jgi:hypothetical protein